MNQNGCKNPQNPRRDSKCPRIPPDDVEEELYKELAIALYQRGMPSSAKASALCGLTRLEFEDLLGKRKVLRHYGDAELEEDLKYARRSQ